MSNNNRSTISLSAQIVAAHAGHNQLDISALPTMIRNIYNTLIALRPTGFQEPSAASHAQGDMSAVRRDQGGQHSHHAHNIYVHPTYGQTVYGDHLVCMEDGLSMKMLKRHLLTVHGLTPDEYRAKWNLPESYPMVAADYARLRSSLAVQSGLGLKPGDRPSKGRKGRKG